MPSSPEVSRASTLAAGLILGIFAVAMFVLIAMAGIRAVQVGFRVGVANTMIVVALTAVAYALGVIAWRFIFNRPNKYGSIMSPVAWRVAAALSFLACLFAVYIAISERTLGSIGGIVGGLTLGIGSWRKSVAIRRAASATAV